MTANITAHRRLLDMLYGWQMNAETQPSYCEGNSIAKLYQKAGAIENPTNEEITAFFTNEVMPVIFQKPNSPWLEVADYYCHSSISSAYIQLCQNAKPTDFYYYISTVFVGYGANTVSIILVPCEYFDACNYLPDCVLDIDHLFPNDKFEPCFSEETAYTSKYMNEVETRTWLQEQGFKSISKFDRFMQDNNY